VPTYRLTLEYDGRDFEGWQVQPEGRRTVQGALEAALAELTREPARVVGAGRTDSGVHAEGQVASVVLEAEWEPERLLRALNGVLPGDAAAVRCERAPDGFHARFDARGKLYCYRVWNGAWRSPLREARFAWVRQPLDLASMRRAAGDLEGTHDFASFQAAGSDVQSTERTLERVAVQGQAGQEVEIRVEGSGFLRHMVRVLVGTLLEVGQGRRAPDSLPGLLAARDRSQAGRTAPPQGLVLMRVSY